MSVDCSSEYPRHVADSAVHHSESGDLGNKWSARCSAASFLNLEYLSNSRLAPRGDIQFLKMLKVKS